MKWFWMNIMQSGTRNTWFRFSIAWNICLVFRLCIGKMKMCEKNAMHIFRYVSLWNKLLLNKKVSTYASLFIHHCRRIHFMSWKCLFDVSCSHWLWMVWFKDWSLVWRFDRRRLIILYRKERRYVVNDFQLSTQNHVLNKVTFVKMKSYHLIDWPSYLIDGPSFLLSIYCCCWL